MSSTMERISNNKIKLRLELGADAFEEGMQKAYLKMRSRVNVPGFRKGKAPRKLIERMYGESTFYEEAFDIVFPDLYDEAIKTHDIQPVGKPELDIETIGNSQGLVVLLEVYVYPSFELGQYKELDVQREDDTVDDEAIEKEIMTMRERNSREEDIEDRPVQDDDIVTLDYSGTVDGVAFEGGTAEDQELTIGSGAFIPGFEEQMVGMQINEEKDLHVTFPTEYHDENLAGKDAIFHVKVHAIRIRELPELDDEFAKDMGFDTLDEYKSDIRVKLEAEAKRKADSAFEDALIDAIIENTEMDVPPPMIERQIDSMVNNLAMRMAYQGIRMEDFFRYTNQTIENVREQYAEDAEHHVKAELILAAIAKAENIEPTDEEMNDVIVRYAKNEGKELEAFRESLTPEMLDYVQDDAKTIAVLNLLRNEAKKPE